MLNRRRSLGRGTSKRVPRRPLRRRGTPGPTPREMAALFSALPGDIAYLDGDFNIQYASAGFASLLGSQAEDLAGKHLFSLSPDPTAETIFRQARDTGQPYQAQNQPLAFLSAAGGQLRWDWRLRPVRAANSGPVTGLILSVTKAAAADGDQHRQVQAVFSNLFNSSPDANVLVDEQGKIITVNQPAEGLFGYSSDELAGQPVEVLVPEALREVHLRHRLGYLAHPRPRPMAVAQSLQLQLFASHRNGASFPVEITLNPIHTNEGLRVHCVIRDARPRVKHEMEIKSSSELVRLLQDVAIAANEATSIENAFQFTLDRVCAYLGWPLGHAYLMDEDNALTSTPIWSGPAAERYPIFKAVSEAMRFRPGVGLPGAVLVNAQPVWLSNLNENEQFARPREAREAGLQTGLAVPILVEKKVAGVLEFFHTDPVPQNPALLAVLPHIGVQVGRVVERYKSEEALRKSAAQTRMVMNNLPVILWVINREGRILLMEGRGVARANLNPQKLIGKIIFEVMDTRPDLLGLLKRGLTGEEIHTEIVGQTGLHYELFYTPYYDANWAVDGVIGLAIDISERKRMEAELDEVKHRLMESIDRERASLAQQLHDGPLQDLFGAFYQIQEIKLSLDEPAQEAANRALQTIQSVNATLRIICGELHPNTLVHLGLDKAIRSHAGRLQDRIPETIIHLDLAPDDQTLPYAHRLGLYRVYQLLISNAVAHSKAEHIWVRLKILPGQVVLEVQDNGQGFEVPDTWIELVREGRLGLVSAIERVQGLNGQLVIDTHPDQGTTVVVTLPR